MSTVKTYLTIVFTYEDDMIRATSNFMEEEIRHELDEFYGIHWGASRKEVHVSYLIEPPIDETLAHHLSILKELGKISNFYVRDEISHE